MPLIVSARKNTLIGRNSDYRFHTNHEATINHDQLVNIMSRARTTLTAPDIVACLSLLTETVSDLVADGNFVKTGLGDFYLCAKGRIDDPDESFRPGKDRQGHCVRLRFRPDRSTEARIARTVRILRDDSRASRKPNIVCLEAVGKRPDTGLVPGDLVRLRGYRLAFDPADEKLGVFLSPDARIPGTRCSVYASVAPRLVILQLPPKLEPGNYSLIIRTATAAGAVREAWMTEPVSVRAAGED